VRASSSPAFSAAPPSGPDGERAVTSSAAAWRASEREGMGVGQGERPGEASRQPDGASASGASDSHSIGSDSGSHAPPADSDADVAIPLEVLSSLRTGG